MIKGGNRTQIIIRIKINQSDQKFKIRRNKKLIFHENNLMNPRL